MGLVREAIGPERPPLLLESLHWAPTLSSSMTRPLSPANPTSRCSPPDLPFPNNPGGPWGVNVAVSLSCQSRCFCLSSSAKPLAQVAWDSSFCILSFRPSRNWSGSATSSTATALVTLISRSPMYSCQSTKDQPAGDTAEWIMSMTS
jgi:hypothetical protein